MFTYHGSIERTGATRNIQAYDIVLPICQFAANPYLTLAHSQLPHEGAYDKTKATYQY